MKYSLLLPRAMTTRLVTAGHKDTGTTEAENYVCEFKEELNCSMRAGDDYLVLYKVQLTIYDTSV